MPIQPQNHILSRLTTAELERLLAGAHRQPLAFGEEICAPGSTVHNVFFPEVGVISVITECADGAMAEAGLIGPEGGLGLLEALGSGGMAARGVVQAAGMAWRAPAGNCRALHETSAAFRQAAICGAEFQAVEARQSMLCRSHHDTPSRLARWLLEIAERSYAGTDRLTLTQEFLALMLGVQRSTVSSVAHDLQTRGLIRYTRGVIRLEDIAGLEAVACECRLALRDQFDRILGAKRAVAA